MNLASPITKQLIEILKAIEEGRVSTSDLIASYNRKVAADIKARNEQPPCQSRAMLNRS